ncbi:hypothetical protein H0H81_006851 [Sphagnurus paluster]|uniref:Clampless protein 1 n=2 Tax=Sphagnurus paluster TaxID=117069 RepID=A0A9P7GRM9_9AGAR|nr:hypothetical protein H0H81_006851 [Sphagnurus paluster]
MLQVASDPTSSDKHSYPHSQRRSGQSPAIQLPPTLSRPAYAEVSRDAIIAVAPELAEVPAEYIRRGLRPRANEMLGAFSALALPSFLLRSRLSSSLAVPLRSPSPFAYPTHILAVSSPKSSSDQVMVFPIHSLVLASHCAQLPRLPPSHQQPHSATLQLPVLPLSIPSPAAFSILHSFMYTHRLDSVLKALFPVPSGFLHSLSHEVVKNALSSGATLHQLSSYLCASASSNLQTLMTHAGHVKELWQNMAALGLHDPELWDTLDLAWEVLLGALNLAAGSQ